MLYDTGRELIQQLFTDDETKQDTYIQEITALITYTNNQLRCVAYNYNNIVPWLNICERGRLAYRWGCFKP